MKSIKFGISAVAWLTLVQPSLTQDDCDTTKPPAFFLAGDSTVAVDGGWGDGFLTYPREGSWGINFGKSGATTVSFKDEGYWANLTDHVQDNVADNDVYVTIQVRHGSTDPRISSRDNPNDLFWE